MVLEVAPSPRQMHTIKETRKYAVMVKKLQQALLRQPDYLTSSSFADRLCSDSDRDSAVSTIRCLNLFYGFGTETFATAVSYLDIFVSKVKVPLKYYSCLASACFLLAAKFHQEPEDVPQVDELVSIHRQLWKPSDLKRMELVILEKLSWKMWPATCPEIAKIFCDILNLLEPCIGRSHLSDVLQKFEVCINYSVSAIYSPAALAITILQLTLKESGLLSPFISHGMLHLHTLAKISDSEACDCHSVVIGVLDNYSNNPSQHPSCLPLPKPTPRVNVLRRPSFYGDTDLPTIHEHAIYEQVAIKVDGQFQYKPKNKHSSWSRCILPPVHITCSVD